MNNMRYQLPPVSKKMRERAKELRNNKTEAEVFLWSKIKNGSSKLSFSDRRLLDSTFVISFRLRRV